MKTRFTYIDDFVFEFVDDGEYREYNVLVSPEKEAEVVVEPIVEPVVSSLLAVPAPVVEPPAPTKKKRTLMGFIRAVWFYIFTGAGAVVDYGISQLTDLPIPPGTATIVGGALYGAKRAFWPDTML